MDARALNKRTHMHVWHLRCLHEIARKRILCAAVSARARRSLRRRLTPNRVPKRTLRSTRSGSSVNVVCWTEENARNRRVNGHWAQPGASQARAPDEAACESVDRACRPNRGLARAHVRPRGASRKATPPITCEIFELVLVDVVKERVDRQVAPQRVLKRRAESLRDRPASRLTSAEDAERARVRARNSPSPECDCSRRSPRRAG